MPAAMASPGRFASSFWPHDLKLAAGLGIEPHDGQHRFAAAGADQTIKTQNLATPQIEIEVLKLGGVRQGLDRQHLVAGHGINVRVNLINLPARHQAYQFLFGRVGDLARYPPPRHRAAPGSDLRLQIFHQTCG